MLPKQRHKKPALQASSKPTTFSWTFIEQAIIALVPSECTCARLMFLNPSLSPILSFKSYSKQKTLHEITQLQSETATTCFPIQARGFENNWHGDPRTPIDSVSPVCGRLMQHCFPWVRHQEVVFHLTFLGSSKMSSRSSFSHIFVMSPKRQDESCPNHFPSISCFTFSFSTWYSKTKQ